MVSIILYSNGETRHAGTVRRDPTSFLFSALRSDGLPAGVDSVVLVYLSSPKDATGRIGLSEPALAACIGQGNKSEASKAAAACAMIGRHV